MKQNYELYTPSDRNVWSELFSRQEKNIQLYACESFREGLKKIGFSGTRIPNIAETNLILKELTGWSIEIVPGIIPQKEFFRLLSQKKFPASTWLRKPEQIDYLEEPDMFHDVFGHVPLLTDENFCEFFKHVADLAIELESVPGATEMLGRLYWFTVEFGLVKENNELRIYGAGILSSPGETGFSVSGKAFIPGFDLAAVLNSGFRTDVFQEKYFVIGSMKELRNLIPFIREELIFQLGKRFALEAAESNSESAGSPLR